jgi:signal transduction histidine kinase
MPFDGSVHPLAGGQWMAGLQTRDATRVLFLRPAPPRLWALARTETWAALAGFWLLSLALGLALARHVTRPLHHLAASLPLVGTDADLPALPTSRRDEIGRLAATLHRTHDSLRSERDRRRAAERHALLGRMASHLAHEVRNPVAAIRLHAQLLEQADSAEAAISRQLIADEAARIEELVAQWLSYAKPAPPVRAPVDLMEILREAVQWATPQARHAGVAIQFAHHGPLVVAADRHRLRQVLGNLLLNAIQAMPRGGAIDLAAHDQGDHIAVSVADHGAGFSQAALARGGEPFFSEKEGGMGLGLAVARDICNAHDGELRLANRPGGGALVTAIIAKTPRSAPPHPQPTPS